MILGNLLQFTLPWAGMLDEVISRDLFQHQIFFYLNGTSLQENLKKKKKNLKLYLSDRKTKMQFTRRHFIQDICFGTAHILLHPWEGLWKSNQSCLSKHMIRKPDINPNAS